MNPSDDNGSAPAYPRTQWTGSDKNVAHRDVPGLTKREAMAMHICAGMVSSIDSEENYQRLREHAKAEGLKVSGWIARDSVKQADALLAALARDKEGE